MIENTIENIFRFHAWKIFMFIIIFQLIMFIKSFWFHKVYEFGYIGLIVAIEIIVWVKFK